MVLVVVSGDGYDSKTRRSEGSSGRGGFRFCLTLQRCLSKPCPSLISLVVSVDVTDHVYLLQVIVVPQSPRCQTISLAQIRSVFCFVCSQQGDIRQSPLPSSMLFQTMFYSICQSQAIISVPPFLPKYQPTYVQ